MTLRFAALSILAVTITACSDSTTEPKANTVISDAPDVGPTLTLSGASFFSSTGTLGLTSAISGNPLALVAAQTGTAPPPPVCTPVSNGIVTCTATSNGLTYTFSTGMSDSLGTSFESSVRGTIPAAGATPSRTIARQSTSRVLTSNFDTSGRLSARIRSSERGTFESLGTIPTTAADTGSSDLSIYINRPTSGGSAASQVRMKGTSRRVVWTRVNGSPATFWRETTTYDSSTVIRSVVETPAGTQRCSVDLAATPIKLTCI